MANFNYLDFFKIPNPTDKKLFIKDKNNNVVYTISTFKISSYFIQNNNIRINFNNTDFAIIDFNNIYESKIALSTLKGAIESLNDVIPFNIEKDIKLYIDNKIAGITGGSGGGTNSGAQGVQGAQGIFGPQGYYGPVGPAGLFWTGSWVGGATYLPNDSVGFGGASWFCFETVNSYIPPVADTAHWALLAAQGVPGVPGTNGAQGNTGLQGNQGRQGSQGNQGNIGLQGNQGNIGLQGNQGGFGPQGNQGNIGSQGNQGTFGLTGNQGSQGNQGGFGPQGNQGIFGLTGNQGPQGNQGNIGLQGNQGMIGITGGNGSQGFQGNSTPRVEIATSYTGGHTININNYDVSVITGQLGSIIFYNPIGTASSMQFLEIAIVDNGTSVSLFYGTQFSGGSTSVMPTITVASSWLYMLFQWNPYIIGTPSWVLQGVNQT